MASLLFYGSLLASMALAGCATRGGITDTVPEERMSGVGDRKVVAKCVFNHLVVQTCDYEVTLLLLDDPAAETSVVMCDMRRSSAVGSGMAVGSAAGPGGFGMGMALGGIIDAVSAGRTDHRPIFMMSIRQTGSTALEATNWVLWQAWVVEERQKLLRDAFAVCASGQPVPPLEGYSVIGKQPDQPAVPSGAPDPATKSAP
ncbi:hypothetical protein D3874_06655 [Oleomonas cavernae]|uniref:Lipoprotein n=1 Tax=Oleomonas cavernae TaxID=2320859 RepID=A0A418W9P7_9PROT|nr:hypothetical protein [Oleomonas cavernae]RJF86740.1 hypothetical protein D3874_06655 [Oleomonas cavernae]